METNEWNSQVDTFPMRTQWNVHFFAEICLSNVIRLAVAAARITTTGETQSPLLG